MPEKPVVILDANALMMPFQFHINLDAELQRLVGECEVIVPSSVLGELRKLQEKKPNARAAIALAEKYRMTRVEGSGDESLVQLANELKGIVVTNDKDLIKQLRDDRVAVISLRSKTHLVLEEAP